MPQSPAAQLANFVDAFVSNAPIEWFLPSPPADPEANESTLVWAMVGIAFPLHLDKTRDQLTRAILCTRRLRLCLAHDRSKVADEDWPAFERNVNELEQAYMQVREKVDAMIEDGAFTEVQAAYLREHALAITSEHWPSEPPAPKATA